MINKLTQFQQFFSSAAHRDKLSFEGQKILRLSNYVLNGQGDRQISPEQLLFLDREVQSISQAEKTKPVKSLVSRIFSRAGKKMQPKASSDQERLNAYSVKIQEAGGDKRTLEDIASRVVQDQALSGRSMLDLYRSLSSKGVGSPYEIKKIASLSCVNQADVEEIIECWLQKLDWRTNLDSSLFKQLDILDEERLANLFTRFYFHQRSNPGDLIEEFDCTYFPTRAVREGILIRILQDNKNGVNPFRFVIFRNIDKFDLTESFLRKVALDHIDSHEELIQYLEHFQFQDEGLELELLQKAAPHFPLEVVRYINRRGNGELPAFKELKEGLKEKVLNHLDCQDSSYASDLEMLCQVFNLSEKERIEQLKKAARQSPESFAEILPEFNITDRDLLMEFADLCDEAQDPNAPWVTLTYPDHFFNGDSEIMRGYRGFPWRYPIYEEEHFNQLKSFLDALSSVSARNVAPLRKLIREIESSTTGKRVELYHALVGKTKLLADMYFYAYLRFRYEWNEALKDSELMVKVQEFTRPELRMSLFQCLAPLFAFKNEEVEAVLQSMDRRIGAVPESKGSSRWYVEQISRVLALQGVNRDVLHLLLQDLFRYVQNFKGSEQGDVVVEALFHLLKTDQLSPVEKEGVIQKILDEADQTREKKIHQAYPKLAENEKKWAAMADKKSKAAQRLENVISTDRKAFDRKNKNEGELLLAVESFLILLQLGDVRGAIGPQSLGDGVRVAFERMIPVTIDDPEKSFITKYFETFGTSRIPKGIFVYGARLSTLSDEQAGVKSFGRFISSVFNERFKEQRYEVAGSDHLTTLSGACPEIYQKWQEGDQALLMELIPDYRTGKRDAFDFKGWILNAIGDGDIPVDALKMEFLKRFEIPPQGTTGLNMHENAIIQFQSLVLSLIGKNQVEAAEILLQLKDLMANEPLLKEIEFAHHVDMMLLPPQNLSGRKLFIYDTDNPYDLFYSGSECPGSCQYLEGNVFNNCGLLGTVMHGWNRLLKVSDSADGKILARSIIRLLWNEAEKKPVLFLERVYPPAVDSATQSAIIAMAKRRAKALGVDLTCILGKNAPGVRYGEPLKALGGAAPYEYSDGSTSGLQKEGKYIIPVSNVLYRHPR